MSKRGKRKDELEAEANDVVEDGSEKAEAKDDKGSPSGSGSILGNRKLLYAIIIIVVVALAAWRLSTLTLPDTGSGDAGSGLAGRVVQSGGVDIGADAAAAKFVDFWQGALGVQYPGIEVELVSVRDYEEISGFYEVFVEITFQGQPQVVPYYVTKDGNTMFSGVVDLNEPIPEVQPAPEPADTGGIQSNPPQNADIQTFRDSGREVCYEDGKPIIRMYASSGCGYCRWNKPMYEKVVKEYMDDGKIVAYLWEDGKNILSDEQEPTPASEEAIRREYGFSGVPAFIFGCKYYRSGAPYSRAEAGEVLEEAELRATIEDLLAA